MVVCAIVLQVAIGIPNGLHNARVQHANQVHAAYVLRTIDHRRNTEVAKYLDAFDNDVFLRAQARTARQLRLSLFANLPPGKG